MRLHRMPMVWYPSLIHPSLIVILEEDDETIEVKGNALTAYIVTALAIPTNDAINFMDKHLELLIWPSHLILHVRLKLRAPSRDPPLSPTELLSCTVSMKIFPTWLKWPRWPLLPSMLIMVMPLPISHILLALRSSIPILLIISLIIRICSFPLLLPHLFLILANGTQTKATSIGFAEPLPFLPLHYILYGSMFLTLLLTLSLLVNY